MDNAAAWLGLFRGGAERVGGQVQPRPAAVHELVEVTGQALLEVVMFGLAVAWACRRSVTALAGAAAGFAVVIAPAYLAAGPAAIKVLVTRSTGITWDTMYQLFWRPVLGYTRFGVSSVPPHLIFLLLKI